MKLHLLCLLSFLSISTPLTAQPSVPLDKEYATKIKALQDQIDELRKQQDALIKEQEQAQKAKAEAAAKRYAKVELRGTLVKTPTDIIVNTERGGQVKVDKWHIAVNNMVFPVNFDKNLLAFAEQYIGKEVVITGSIFIGFTKVPAQHEGRFDYVEGAIGVTVATLKLPKD